jgi:hypothetical protein
VVDRELKVHGREQLNDLRFECELKVIMNHESKLNSREATLAAGQKDLEDTHVGVLACELTAEV